MNIKDFTLKITYICDGKPRMETVDGDSVLEYKNDLFSLSGEVLEDRLKLSLFAQKPVELKMAELIYDRYFENNDRFYANGFQSWTTSREYKRGDEQRGLHPLAKLPVAKAYATASGDYDFAQYGKDLFHSVTYCYLRNGEKVELFGSLNERTGYTLFYADMKENVFAVVKELEGALAEGEYELFDLMRAQGGYDEVFDAYFAAYPRKHTGRVGHFAGYTSWYNYYQNINEAVILRDLRGLKRAGDSANIFQIDDGFETMVGDWDIDVNKFPSGLAPIVEKIHGQGLKAGLWLAPFAAQFKAKIVKEHPDWFIRGKNGKMLISGMAWGGFYALDYLKEEVRAYIKALFDRVFNEWGFDMVKLDFLYSAAILPRAGKSRGTLMCEAMDFLRECCGDKIILGCGVPLGPAFGVVDACRIGCDAENSFKDKYYVKITNQEVISTRNAMNNAIFRRHLNGRIFANDPDVFFLRNGGVKTAKYNDTQKRLLAKINHIFGSVLFVSDDIGDYDDNQLAILLESYKPFGGKVTKAEYISLDKISISYVEDGKAYKLVFDTYTGEYNVR